jgi:hypothetical protein
MDLVLAALVFLLLLSFFIIGSAAMRGMAAGQRQMNADFERWFQRQKWAPAVVVIGTAVLAVVSNTRFLELLVTGRLLDSARLLERFPDHHSYWFDLAASGLVSLVLNIKIAGFFWRMRRSKMKPNKPARQLGP